jgi:Protein of unknown function (DUF1698).
MVHCIEADLSIENIDKDWNDSARKGNVRAVGRQELFMLNILRRVKRSKKSPSEAVEAVFDRYELSLPTHQNAIDALPGWNSSFPKEVKVKAGSTPLFADGRIEWALSKYGPIKGKRILEVGPLEGMHTYRLDKEAPAQIDAVEANKLCFLRCLVTKQILDIRNATFLLGDVQEWLLESPRYDLAFASGVLYHMADPGEFLRRLSLKADALYVWTHYFDEAAMPEGDLRRHPFSGRIEERVIGECRLRYHERSYRQANNDPAFCGGLRDRHYWMDRKDILEFLSSLGYNDIVIGAEEPQHPGGPSFSIFARRT